MNKLLVENSCVVTTFDETNYASKAFFHSSKNCRGNFHVDFFHAKKKKKQKKIQNYHRLAIDHNHVLSNVQFLLSFTYDFNTFDKNDKGQG